MGAGWLTGGRKRYVSLVFLEKMVECFKVIERGSCSHV